MNGGVGGLGSGRRVKVVGKNTPQGFAIIGSIGFKADVINDDDDDDDDKNDDDDVDDDDRISESKDPIMLARKR